MAGGLGGWRLTREAADWLRSAEGGPRIVPAWLHADRTAFAASFASRPSWLWWVLLAVLLASFALLLVPRSVRSTQHAAKLGAGVALVSLALLVSFFHLLLVQNALVNGVGEPVRAVPAASVLACGGLGALLAAIGFSLGAREPAARRAARFRGAALGLAAGAMWLVLSAYLHSRLLVPANAMGAVRDWLGPTRSHHELSSVFVPGLALTGLAAGALTVAAVHRPAEGTERRLAVLVALAALAGLVGWGELMRGSVMSRFDMLAPDLRAAARLDDTPETGLLVFGSVAWPRDKAVRMAARGTELRIPAARHNVDRLQHYLADHPEPTVHLPAAAQALVALLEMRSDWDRLTEVHLGLAKRTTVDGSSVLKAAQQLGPWSARLLDALDAPGAVVLPNECRAALAGVAHQLGREDQAKALWQAALAAGFDARQPRRHPGCGPAPRYDKGAPPSHALLRGQILVRGQPSDRVEVLLGEGEGDIVASWRSTRPDSSGHFRFEHLAPQSYQLHVETDRDLELDASGASVTGKVVELRIESLSSELDVGVLQVTTP